jgi:hypothetical protein
MDNAARRPGQHVAALMVGIVAALTATLAQADAVSFGPNDVTSLFTISKSENRNEVVFAVHLDERCAPVGDAPVFAFWRMREKGEGVLERVLPREQAAYGIARQSVVARAPDGGVVDIALRAIPARHIVVQTQRRDSSCAAWSRTSIAGTDAYLYNVYVKLRPLGVDHILLSGWATDGKRVVTERIDR